MNHCFQQKKLDPSPLELIQARVARAEIKTSRAGNQYLSCDIQIIQGASQGKLIDANFHIYSQDSKFRADSRRKLARLASVCGIEKVMKPNDLLDIPFLVEIGETKDSFGDTNIILGYGKLK